MCRDCAVWLRNKKMAPYKAPFETDDMQRLAVSMEVEDEMRRASVAATAANIGDWVEGAVYNMRA